MIATTIISQKIEKNKMEERIVVSTIIGAVTIAVRACSVTSQILDHTGRFSGEF